MGSISKKLGPFPRWVWLLLGLLVAVFVFRRMRGGSGGSVQATPTQSLVTSSPDAQMGAVPSAGAPGDTGQTTSDLVSALGGQQASLLQALEAQSQDVLALAQSQIAAAQTQTSLGSFNTQTQPATAPQPGGSNAPAIVYVSPTVYTSPGGSASPPSPAPVKASSTSTPTKFYTYKRDVKLASGQTVHFRSGRGYYAA